VYSEWGENYSTRATKIINIKMLNSSKRASNFMHVIVCVIAFSVFRMGRKIIQQLAKLKQ